MDTSDKTPSEVKIPSVFISYSWTSPEFIDQIIHWAERLVNDGVDVHLDKWALKEGQDTHAYMERMVNDPQITKVLVFSDSVYAQKANERKGGAGTEAQIMSGELYGNVSQTKFIPIVCEVDDDGHACLPTFIKTRFYIDFSSDESVEGNWEMLVRAVYGKPLYKKPSLGKTPSYILEEGTKPVVNAGKFEALKNAIAQDKKSIELYRRDYVDSVYDALQQLEIRDESGDEIQKKFFETLDNTLPYRDQIVDYFNIILAVGPEEERAKKIIQLFERLLTLKYPPYSLSQWREWWFEPFGFLLHELVMYFVATCIKEEEFAALDQFLKNRFLPPVDSYSDLDGIQPFTIFYTYSKILDEWNSGLEKKWRSAYGEWIKRRSTNSKITFQNLIEADYLLVLRSDVEELDGRSWYGHTLVYARMGLRGPFFMKVHGKDYFKRVAPVIGVKNKQELEAKIENAKKTYRGWGHQSILMDLKIDGWDSIA